jgi:hypothetical protein
MPTYAPWPVWAGNNEPYVWTLVDQTSGDRIDLTGVEVRLLIRWPGAELLLSTLPGQGIALLDQAEPTTRGMFSVALTNAQSRALPAGAIAQYEIELRGYLAPSNEGTKVYGPVIVQGGNNPDGAIA